MEREKAPAFDDITFETLCKVWIIIKRRMRYLMKRVLQEERSPKHWKIGIVKVFYKVLGKDLQVPQSYRLLTLLPVMKLKLIK